MQVYYPLDELQKLLRKCRTDNEREDLKNSVFTNILVRPQGDMTRFIRSFKNIINSDYQEEFLEEQREIAADVLDSLPPVGVMSPQIIRDQVRVDDVLSNKLEYSVDKYLTRTKKTETRNRPTQLVEKATNLLESIDLNVLSKLNDSELRRIRHQLERLTEVLDEMRENLPL